MKSQEELRKDWRNLCWKWRGIQILFFLVILMGIYLGISPWAVLCALAIGAFFYSQSSTFRLFLMRGLALLIGASALPFIGRRMIREKDHKFRQVGARLVRKIGPGAFALFHLFGRELKKTDLKRRRGALLALGELPSWLFDTPPLLKYLLFEDPSWQIRKVTVQILGEKASDGDEEMALLERALEDESISVRQMAGEALRRRGVKVKREYELTDLSRPTTSRPRNQGSYRYQPEGEVEDFEGGDKKKKSLGEWMVVTVVSTCVLALAALLILLALGVPLWKKNVETLRDLARKKKGGDPHRSSPVREKGDLNGSSPQSSKRRASPSWKSLQALSATSPFFLGIRGSELWGGKIRLAPGVQIRTYPLKLPFEITSSQFSISLQAAKVACVANKTLRVGEIRIGENRVALGKWKKLPLGLSNPTALAFDSPGKRVALGRRTLEVWEVEKGRRIRIPFPHLPPGDFLVSLSFGKDGESLAALTDKGHVGLWRGEGLSLVMRRRVTGAQGKKIVFWKGDFWAFISHQGELASWQIESQKVELMGYRGGEEVTFFFLSPSYLLVLGKREAGLFDFKKREFLYKISLDIKIKDRSPLTCLKRGYLLWESSLKKLKLFQLPFPIPPQKERDRER